MHLPNIVATSSSDRYRVIRWQVTGNPSVTDQPTVETTLADALEQVLMELKKLQDQGRVRLQYAVLEGDRFYIVGYIDDISYNDVNLYNLQIRVEDLLYPFGWEVGLSVVHPNSTFQSAVPLTNV
jgi:hypothetical protein